MANINVPTTKQTVNQLDQAQGYLESRKQGQGEGARRTVDDINQVLKDAKNLVREKDLGDAVGSLVLNGTAAGNEAAKTVSRNAPSIDGVDVDPSGANVNAVRDDAYEAAQQVRRLSGLIVTSPAFRKFLWNTYTLTRDTFGPQIDNALEQRLNEGRKDDLTRKLEGTYEQAQNQGQQTRDEARTFASSQQQNLRQGDYKSAVNEVRDKAQETSNRAKSSFQNAVRKESRDELSARWQKLSRQLKNDPNLQYAIDDLKHILTRLREDAQPVIQQVQQQGKEIANQVKEQTKQTAQATQANAGDATSRAAHDARELIEKFAGGKSLQPLIDSVKAWVRTIANDQVLRRWVQEFCDFTYDTTKTPERLTEDEHLDRLNSLIDQGRQLTQGRHRQIAEDLLDQSRDFGDALRNDTSTNALRRSLTNVVSDLFIDSQGKFVVKPDVYAQLKTALLPSLSDVIRDVRIQHVEEHTDEIDFALENILIDGSDLLPDQFDVTNIADLSLGKEHTGLNFRFRISCKGLTPKVRNAAFRYEKHTFPKLSDFGAIDVTLSGSGISFNVDIELIAEETNDRDVNRTFRANDVTCNINNLKLDFHHAKHETLYKLFKPIIVSKVTRQIEKAFKEQLFNFVDQLDQIATDARDRAAETLDQVAGDRIVRGVDNNVGNSGNSRALRS